MHSLSDHHNRFDPTGDAHRRMTVRRTRRLVCDCLAIAAAVGLFGGVMLATLPH